MRASTLLQPFLIFLVWMLSGLSEGACAQSLTLLTEIAAPNQVILPNGEIGGPAAEVVREIQRRVKNADPIKVVPWARGYMMLERQPNTALFLVARTAARDPLFHWVGPFTESSYRIYVKANSMVVLNNLDDAKRLKSIGVYRDDARDQVLTKAGLTNLDRANDNTSNVKKLMLDRIEAFAASSNTIDDLMASADVPRELVREALSFLTIQTWLAFSMETPESTVAAWTDALESMKKDKSFDKIQKAGNPKWKAPKKAITQF
jgi:polar amino acid transport system substrate-binding protein